MSTRLYLVVHLFFVSFCFMYRFLLNRQYQVKTADQKLKRGNYRHPQQQEVTDCGLLVKAPELSASAATTNSPHLRSLWNVFLLLIRYATEISLTNTAKKLKSMSLNSQMTVPFSFLLATTVECCCGTPAKPPMTSVHQNQLQWTLLLLRTKKGEINSSGAWPWALTTKESLVEVQITTS